MSIMDVDKADENIDYEVIYKKKFDEINKQLEELVDIQRIDFNNLEHKLNNIKSDLNLYYKHATLLYSYAVWAT